MNPASTQGPVYCRHCLSGKLEDAELEAGWGWEEAPGWLHVAAIIEDEWRTLQQMEAVER